MAQIVDRLPLTVEKLKLSKLGKLIMRLTKDPPTPGELSLLLRLYPTYMRLERYQYHNRLTESRVMCIYARNSWMSAAALKPTSLYYMYLTTVFACAPTETISDQGHGIEPGAKVAKNAEPGGVRQDGYRFCRGWVMSVHSAGPTKY